jgi:hypothetical protein
VEELAPLITRSPCAEARTSNSHFASDGTKLARLIADALDLVPLSHQMLYGREAIVLDLHMRLSQVHVGLGHV